MLTGQSGGLAKIEASWPKVFGNLARRASLKPPLDPKETDLLQSASSLGRKSTHVARRFSQRENCD